MCHEKESKKRVKRVTLIMPGGGEVGPVKIVGLSEVQTAYGPMLEADVYGKPEIIAGHAQRLRFMAIYTNFKDKPKDPKAQ